MAAKKINRIEWPGNSPNLNPIENLWATMKRKLGEMDEMIRAIKKVWREVEYFLFTLVTEGHSTPEDCTSAHSQPVCRPWE